MIEITENLPPDAVVVTRDTEDVRERRWLIARPAAHPGQVLVRQTFNKTCAGKPHISRVTNSFITAKAARHFAELLVKAADEAEQVR